MLGGSEKIAGYSLLEGELSAQADTMIAAYSVQKLDFGALAIFDYQLYASNQWKVLKCGQQSDIFCIPPNIFWVWSIRKETRFLW